MMKRLLPLALIAVACEAQDAQCVRERAAMVENIQAYARSDLSLLGPQGISESVLEAVRQTERHRFIPGRSCSVAYMDGPVPIGRGQTTSQPFVVALMTDLAAVKPDHTLGSWHRFRLPDRNTGGVWRGRFVLLRLSRPQ